VPKQELSHSIPILANLKENVDIFSKLSIIALPGRASVTKNFTFGNLAHNACRGPRIPFEALGLSGYPWVHGHLKGGQICAGNTIATTTWVQVWRHATPGTQLPRLQKKQHLHVKSVYDYISHG